MKEIFFEDHLQICDKSLQLTPEGYLMLDAIIARSGEQSYLAAELGIYDGDYMREIIVDRPVVEVTDAMTVASFMNKPITNNHPDGGIVDSTNIQHLGKGAVLDVEPTKEGKLKASLIVYNADLVNDIYDKENRKLRDGGKRELSAGYKAAIEFSDDGNRAVQRKIRGNHVAFVDSARCGRECSILDAKKQEKSKMAKLKINGVEVEISDAVAPMVKTVVDENGTLKTQLADAKDATDTVQAKLDAATDEVEELKKATISDADVQKQAEKLVTVWKQASLIDSDFDCKGKSEAEIKRGIVTAVLGDALPKDASDAYVEARFDIMVEDKGTEDPMSKQFSDAGKQHKANVIDANEAREKAAERNRQRWNK